MRKTLQTIIAILAFAAVVTACTKTEDTANEAVRQGEATIERIMDFKQQMEEAKANPGMKSSVYMSVDDAVWNIEALFNLTYAYPELAYGKTVDCDTTLYLPVSTNDSVAINDLAAFYGMMYDAVRAIYWSVDLDDKRFLILDVEAGERSGNVQAIGLHTVQGSERGEHPQDTTIWQLLEYFKEGSPWYYGGDLGRLDGSFYGFMDAADTLSNMLNATLVEKAPGGFVYIYTDIITKELGHSEHCVYSNNHYPGCGPYCEFYKENPSGDDFLLDTDQMNFHYFGEKYLVRNVLPAYGNNPVPSTHYLINVMVSDHNGASKIWHHTQAAYGHRQGVGKNEMVKDNL